MQLSGEILERLASDESQGRAGSCEGPVFKLVCAEVGSQGFTGQTASSAALVPPKACFVLLLT